MKGFPKVFSTKQDYYNVRDTYPEQTKAQLKRIMDGRFIWKNIGELAEGETGLVDDTHKVIETSGDMMSENKDKTVFVQMILTEDENCEFYRQGWNIEEAINFLAYEPVETITE